jgi:hypothetical protein
LCLTPNPRVYNKMGAKNYKHIAIEKFVANEFNQMKKNLQRYKKKPTDTETMKVLLEKNSRFILEKDDILKLLYEPDEE